MSVATLKTNKKKNKDKKYEYSFKKSTILLVEDVITNREIVKGYLENQNITILEAQNGQEGVDLAISLQPDLILMDIQMPIMDGYTAIDILKYNPSTKSLPIVALTASTMKSDEERIRAICDGYLRKPVSRDELIEELVLHLPHSKKRLSPSVQEDEQEEVQQKATEILISDTFKQNFQKKFYNEYVEIKELMSNSDIEQFSKKLLEMAQEENETALAEYLEKIIADASSFKLEEIEEKFLKLENIFQ